MTNPNDFFKKLPSNPEGIEDSTKSEIDAFFSKVLKPETKTGYVLGEKGLSNYNTSIDKVRRFFDNRMDVAPSSEPYFMESVARSQSGWELMGKSLVHTVAEIIGGTFETMGTLGDPRKWAGVFSNSHDTFKRNIIQELGHIINQGTKDALPVYMTSKAQEGFAPGDATWWASMFPTVASMATIFVPIAGSIAGVKALAQGTKLARALGKTGKFAAFGRNLEIGSAALMSRHVDSFRESMGTYESQFNRLKSLSYTDEEAARIAGQMAASAYRRGYMNIAFDVVEWGVMLKPISRITEKLGQRTARYLTANPKVAPLVGEKTTEAAAKFSFKEFGVEYGKLIASESMDEMMIDFFQKEGIRAGEIKNGMLEDGTPFLDRFANHFTDRHTWDSGFWGAFGALAMGGGQGLINKILYSKQARLRDEKLANDIATNVDNIKSTLQSINNLVDTEQFAEANMLLNSLKSELLTSSASSGALDTYLEVLDSIEKMNAEQLKEHGLDESVKKALPELRQEIIEGKKTIETFMKDYSNKQRTYTPQENQYIALKLANLKFTIDGLNKGLSKLDQQGQLEEAQIEELRKLLDGKIDVIDVLSNIQSDNKTNVKKGIKKLSNDPKTRVHLEALLEQKKLNNQLDRAKGGIEIMQRAIEALTVHLNSFSEDLDMAQQQHKEAKQKELEFYTSLIEGHETTIKEAETKLEDTNKIVEETKEGINQDDLKRAIKLNDALDSFKNEHIKKSKEAYNRHIAMHQQEMTDMLDDTKRNEHIDKIIEKQNEEHKEEVKLVKAKIRAAKDTELDKIERDNANIHPEIKSEITKRKADLKNEAANEAVKKEAKDSIEEVEEQTPTTSLEEEDYNRSKKQIVTHIKNNSKTISKKLADEYNERIKTIQSELDKSDKGAAAYKKALNDIMRVGQEATLIVSDASSIFVKQENTTDLTNVDLSDVNSVLNNAASSFEKAIVFLRKIANEKVEGTEEFLVISNMIQHMSSTLAEMLDTVRMYSYDNILTREQILYIAATATYGRKFAEVVKEHINMMSFHPIMQSLTNPEIRNALFVLPRVVDVLHNKLGELSNIYEITEEHVQLFKYLLAKIVGYRALHSVELNPNLNDELSNKVLESLVNYIKYLAGRTQLKEVTFDDISLYIQDSIQSQEEFIYIMEVVKDTFNSLHEQGKTFDQLQIAKVETDINQDYYNKVLAKSKRGNINIQVIYKQGLSLTFGIYDKTNQNDTGTLVMLDKEQTKKYKVFSELRPNDKVKLKKRKDGRIELFKGNLGLGLFLNDNYMDRYGIKYDLNGEYISFVSYLAQSEKNFEILVEHIEVLKEIINTRTVPKDVPVELKDLLAKMASYNLGLEVKGFEELSVDAITHMIVPVFYLISQYHRADYQPDVERLKQNYDAFNHRMRLDFEYAKAIRQRLEEGGNKGVEMSISSFSTGSVMYNGSSSYDNISKRLPQSDRDTLTVGVVNLLNSSLSIIDIKTGKLINVVNPDIRRKRKDSDTVFYVVSTVKGQKYLIGVNQATVGQSDHLGKSGYGKEIAAFGEQVIKDFFNMKLSVEQAREKLRRYISVNFKGQNSITFRFIQYKDGDRAVHFKSHLVEQVGEKNERNTYYYSITHNKSTSSYSYFRTKELDGDYPAKPKTQKHSPGFDKAFSDFTRQGLLGTRRAILTKVYESEGTTIIDTALQATKDGKITFTDDITGDIYEGENAYFDFLVKSGALVTNLDGIRADVNGEPSQDGQILSNHNELGTTPTTGMAGPRSTIFIKEYVATPIVVLPKQEVKTPKDKTEAKEDTTEVKQEVPVDNQGKVLTLPEFMQAFRNTVLLSDKNFEFLISNLNTLYRNNIKIEVRIDPTQFEQPFLQEGGVKKYIQADVDRKTHTIILYQAFVHNMQKNEPYDLTKDKITPEDFYPTTTAYHELLHLLFEGLRQHVDEEKFNSFKDSLSEFIVGLRNQLSDTNSPFYIAPSETNNTRKWLQEYIKMIDATAEEDKWQEALAYALSHIHIARALNDVISPNTPFEQPLSLFQKIIQALFNLINKAFDVNLELNPNSRLAEILDISYVLGEAAEGQLHPIVITVKPSTLQSTELPIQLKLQFAEETERLEQNTETDNLVSDWEALNLEEKINGYKYDFVYYADSKNKYSRFEGTRVIETTDIRGRKGYKIIVPKPGLSPVHSVELSLEPRNSSQKFSYPEVDHIQRLLTRMVIDMIYDNAIPTIDDYVASLKSTGTGRTIKSDVIEKIEKTLEANKKGKVLNVAFLNRLLDDLRLPQSQAYLYFQMYFNNNFKAKIRDVDAYVDELEDGIDIDVSVFKNKDWDENNQLKIDTKDNVNIAVKVELARLTRTTDTISRLSHAADIKDVWFTLQSHHRNDKTVDQYINTLYNLSKSQGSIFTNLYNKLADPITEEDKIFLNSYLQVMNKSLLEIYAMTFEMLSEKQTLDFTVQNRSSYGTYALADNWTRRLEYLLDTDQLGKVKKIFEALIKPDLKDKDVLNSHFIKSLLKSTGAKFDTEKGDNLATRLNEDTAKKLMEALGLQGVEYIKPLLNRDFKKWLFNVAGDMVRLDYLYKEIDIKNKVTLEENKNAKPEEVKSLTNKDFDSFNSKGYLMFMANAMNMYSIAKADFSFLNVNGDAEFALQDPFFISDFFKPFLGVGVNDANRQVYSSNIKQAFDKIATDIRNQHSNWLWIDKATKGYGIFDYIEGANGSKVMPFGENPSSGVYPERFSKHMGVALFNGTKFIEDRTGIKADKNIGVIWDLVNILAFNAGNLDKDGTRSAWYTAFHSDSPRTLLIKGFAFPVLDDLVTDKFVFDNDRVFKDESYTQKALLNMMLQDLAEMYAARDMMFKVDKSGNITLNEIYDKDSKENQVDKLHKVKHGKYNKQGEFIILDEGKPVGRAFKFLNLATTKNGKEYTFGDYLKEKYPNTNNYELTFNSFEEASKMMKKDMLDFAQQTIVQQYERTYKKLSKAFAFLKDAQMRQRVTGQGNKENVPIVKTELELQQLSLDFTVNYAIAQAEMRNIWLGAANEYDNDKQFNKRAGQWIKPGDSIIGNLDVRTLIVNDVFASSSIINSIRKYIPEHMAKKYERINTTDGFSVITLEHYVARLKAEGQYDNFKDVIDAIEEQGVYKISPTKYKRYLESLKYFYYDRSLVDNGTYNYLSSTQQKYSTLVIGKNLYKGTQLNRLHEVMANAGVDEMVFNSSAKVSKTHPITIDADGNLSITDHAELGRLVETRDFSKYRKQLEIKPHMLDEVIKLGVQITKIIFNNLEFDKVYHTDSSGKKYTGKDLFMEFNKTLSQNIIQSTMNLLNKWGAVQNGQILSDGENILVDSRKITKELERYIIQEGIDINMYNAIKYDEETGESALPFHAPIHYRKLAAVILSKITKNIVDQKLPGIHAPIIPNLFMQPDIDYMVDSDVNVDKLKEEGSITYLDEIHERKDYKLRINILSDGKYEVEAVINPWLSQFVTAGKTIDINILKDTGALEMIGMRIPTEGKQSMIVVKVVGFMNNGATVAMFPDEMIIKTGWDFDIDTIYMYYKNLELTKNSRGAVTGAKVIEFLGDNQDEERFKRWKSEYDTVVAQQIEDIVAESEEESLFAEMEALREKYRNIKDAYISADSQIKEIKSALEGRTNFVIYNAMYGGAGKVNEETGTYDVQAPLPERVVNYIKTRDNGDIQSLINNIAEATFTLYRKKKDAISITEKQQAKSTIDYLYNELQVMNDAVSEANQALNYKEVKRKKQKLEKIYKSLQNKTTATKTAYYRQVYDTLDIYGKNTLKARQNRIIEIFHSILSQEQHLGESLKPNVFDESVEASTYVNLLLGYDLDGVNMNFYADAAAIRDINMAVRHLKANSVGTDGMMSVLGVTGAYLQSGIPMTFTKEQINVKGEDAKIIAKLEKIVGKGNVKINGNFVTLSFQHLSNNASKTWTDLLGEKITDQASQTTSHILDAVSSLMGKNINEYTLPVYKLLTYTTQNIMFNGRGNKHILPALLIHQPILIDWVDELILNKVDGYADPHQMMQNVAFSYYKQLVNHTEFDKTVEEFTKTMPESDANKIKARVKQFKKNNTRLDTNTLGQILEIVEFININQSSDTFSQLKQGLKDFASNNLTVSYYANQIKQLRYFEGLYNKAQSVVGLVATLNQDKKKLGPTISDTRINMKKMDNYNKTVEEQREMLAEDPTFDSDIILIDDVPVIEAIIPKHFGKEVESVYPMFQTYYEYGSKTAEGVFNHISALETPVLCDIRNAFIKDLTNNTKSIEVENLINSFAVFYATEKMPYLMMEEHEAIPTPETEIALRRRVNGVYNTYEESRKTIHELLDGDKVLGDKHFDAFQKLSLSNKIEILFESRPHSDTIYDSLRYKSSHILTALRVQNNRKHFNKHERSHLIIDTLEIDKNYTMHSLTDMFYGTDKYFRDVALDIVRYSFFNSGLNYGNNPSKFIPVEILTDGNNIFGNYGYMIKKIKPVLESMVTDHFIQNLVKSNWDNTAFVPVFTRKKFERGKQFPGKATGQSVFQPSYFDYKGERISFIVELKEVVDLEPSFREKQYIAYNHSGNKNLLKRYDFEYQGEEVVLFLPIEKLDMFELDTTSSEKNKYHNLIGGSFEYSTKQGNMLHLAFPEKMMDENHTTYLNIKEVKEVAQVKIGEIKTQNKLNSAEVVIHPAKNQTEAFEQLSKDYDTIVYVGNESFEYKMFNNRTNVQLVSPVSAKYILEKIRIPKDATKIAIIGNTELNAENREVLYDFTDKLLLKYPGIDRIGTISNSPVSSLIKRTTKVQVDNYNSNENIPSTILPSVEIVLDELDTMTEIGRQAKVLSTMIHNTRAIAVLYDKKKDKFVDAIKDLTKELTNKQVADEIRKGQIGGMVEGLDNQIKLFTILKPHAIKLYESLDTVNFLEWSVKDKYSQKDKDRISAELKEALELMSVAELLSELSELNYTPAEETNKKQKDESQEEFYKQYNTKLKELVEISKDIVNLKKKITIKAAHYLGAIVYENSHNPNFITKFNSLNPTMDITTMNSNINKMLKENEDLNFFMMWLDSIFDSGITVVDNVMLEYIKQQKHRQVEYVEFTDQLADLIGALWGDKYVTNLKEVMEGKAPVYDRKTILDNKMNTERKLIFTKIMFDESTGGLRTEYDWGAYYKERREAYKKLNEQLKLAEKQSDTRLAEQMKIKANIAFNEWAETAVLDFKESILEKDQQAELQELAENMNERAFRGLLKQRGVEEKYSKKAKKKVFYEVKLTDRFKSKFEITPAVENLRNFISNTSRELLEELYGEYDIPSNFYPIVMDQTSENALLNFIGWMPRDREALGRGVNDETYRIYEAPMLSYVEYNKLYKLPHQDKFETDGEYQDRVLDRVNKEYKYSNPKSDKVFNSIEEIKEYNEIQRELNKEESIKKMNKDPYYAMDMFMRNVLNYKTVKNFSNSLSILRSQIKSDSFKVVTKEKGKARVISGKDSNILTRIEAFKNTIHNAPKVVTRIDKVLNLIKQGTSLTYMALNFTGGVKNVLHGYLRELMESSAGEFISRPDLLFALSHYNVVDIMKDMNSQYSDNLYVAILKAFPNLLDLKNEEGFERDTYENMTHRLLMYRHKLYFMNNAGEHLMQYTMLIAMLRSHRMVNGNFISETEYIGDLRVRALEEVLDQDQLNDLRVYIAKQKEYNKEYGNDPSRFLYWWMNGKTNGKANIRPEQFKEYTDKILGSKKRGIVGLEQVARQEFANFESLYDQFELKQGRAVLKEGSQLDTDKLALFERRVHKLNHSIHGIYNRIDRNMMKESVMGDLALQFRSWLRPNFNQFFGMRWGRSVYDESLGSYRKGAYTSLMAFVGQPISNSVRMYRKNEIQLRNLLTEILHEYFDFFANARTHWATLSLRDRQNVWRATRNMINMVTLGGMLTLLTLLFGADDDEEQAYAYAFAIYELNAAFTETAEFFPVVGWIGTLNRTKQYTMASERVVIEWFNIMKLITLYPFQDEGTRLHQRGVYKGKSKLFTSMMKNTPIVRQGFKMAYIPQYTSWYKLYNPFTWIVPDLKEDDKKKKDKAEFGMKSSNFSKGKKWEIVKDLKGYPSHSKGGVDIKLSSKGVSVKNNNSDIIAQNGLLLPNVS